MADMHLALAVQTATDTTLQQFQEFATPTAALEALEASPGDTLLALSVRFSTIVANGEAHELVRSAQGEACAALYADALGWLLEHMA